jgi:hypothetical protein
MHAHKALLIDGPGHAMRPFTFNFPAFYFSRSCRAEANGIAHMPPRSL